MTTVTMLSCYTVTMTGKVLPHLSQRLGINRKTWWQILRVEKYHILSLNLSQIVVIFQSCSYLYMRTETDLVLVCVIP